MSGIATEENSAPTQTGPASERLSSLDVLRGLALLGVLIVNVDAAFRTNFFEQFLPQQYGSGADQMAHGIIRFFIEFKAITIFSALFGVGLAIQQETLGARGDATVLLARRLLVLLAFGLIHLFLIWNGDILTGYAIAGLIALAWLRGPTWLTGWASLAALGFFLCLPLLPIQFAFPSESWMVEHVASARRVYGEGSFFDVLAFRISEVPRIWVFDFYILSRTIGLILFGAFVWRSGVLRDLPRHRRLIVTVAALGLAGGCLLTWLNGTGGVRPVELIPAVALVLDNVAPMVLALGYCALVLYVAGLSTLGRLLAWAAPVGRMAFTNYISQSVIMGLVFYGYGLGLMGEVGVAAGLAISVALYVAQVVLSAWWLRSHHFGPLEWLWRTAMYGERQPWAKRAVSPGL